VILVARFATVVVAGLVRGHSHSTSLLLNEDMLGGCYGGCYRNGLHSLEVAAAVVGEHTVSVGLGHDIRPLSSLVFASGWPSVVSAIDAGALQRGLVRGQKGSAESIVGSSTRLRGCIHH